MLLQKYSIFELRIEPEHFAAKLADARSIGNVWGILQEKLREREYSKTEQMKEDINKEWLKFPISSYENMIDRIPFRLKLNIDQGRDQIHEHCTSDLLFLLTLEVFHITYDQNGLGNFLSGSCQCLCFSSLEQTFDLAICPNLARFMPNNLGKLQSVFFCFERARCNTKSSQNFSIAFS